MEDKKLFEAVEEITGYVQRNQGLYTHRVKKTYPKFVMGKYKRKKEEERQKKEKTNKDLSI